MSFFSKKQQDVPPPPVEGGFFSSSTQSAESPGQRIKRILRTKFLRPIPLVVSGLAVIIMSASAYFIAYPSSFLALQSALIQVVTLGKVTAAYPPNYELAVGAENDTNYDASVKEEADAAAGAEVVTSADGKTTTTTTIAASGTKTTTIKTADKTVTIVTKPDGTTVTSTKTGTGTKTSTTTTTTPPATKPPVQPAATPPPIRTIISSAGFTHPGVFDSLGELNFSKQKIASGQAPWITIYNQAKGGGLAARTTTLSGLVRVDDGNKACDLNNVGKGCVVECGGYSIPDKGCKTEVDDAAAAYTQALLWYYSGNEAYAQKSIAILNNYSKALKNHTNDNAPLQAGWAAESFVRAAEIIRYTYTPSAGKAVFNVAQFKSMLTTAFMPLLKNFNYSEFNGNWDLVAVDGLINIAVFNDDRALYNTAINRWKDRVPTYIYLTSDGATPIAYKGTRYVANKAELGCYWLNNKTAACQSKVKTDPGLNYQNGMTQESCRDFVHAGMGLAAMLNTAETASHQGTDLYGPYQTRIMQGLEYGTQIIQYYGKNGKYPTGFCKGITGLDPPNYPLFASEVGYNAYTVRRGAAFRPISVPNLAGMTYTNNDPLRSYITQVRSTTGSASLISIWETLTHHDVGNGI